MTNIKNVLFKKHENGWIEENEDESEKLLGVNDPKMEKLRVMIYRIVDIKFHQLSNPVMDLWKV